MTWWQKILELLFASVSAKPAPAPEPAKPVELPWREWFLARLGWTEFDHDGELSKGWHLTKDCKGYKTVIGLEHAWCGMSLATALNSCGYAYPVACESAAAWRGYGTPIDWKARGIPKGAVVVVRGESFHVATADRDHDPAPAYVDLLGGNQDNAIKVKRDRREIVYVGWPVKA